MVGVCIGVSVWFGKVVGSDLVGEGVAGASSGGTVAMAANVMVGVGSHAAPVASRMKAPMNRTVLTILDCLCMFLSLNRFPF